MAKILIVDDDLYLRDLYEEILKEEGHEVTTAADGEEGLAKINAGAYDLVLLDVMMPKLDGLGLLKKLGEEAPLPKAPVVVLLTNLGNDPAVKEALQHGAKSYLVKAEMTPNQIADEVKKYV
jgi:CheY-like chemotaxis protein